MKLLVTSGAMLLATLLPLKASDAAYEAVPKSMVRNLETIKTLSNGANLISDITSPDDGVSFSLNANCEADESFSAEASVGEGDPNISYVFIIDKSGSTSSIIGDIKSFFVALTDRLFDEGSAKNIGVVAFANSATILRNLTPVANKQLIKNAINSISSGGNTNCVDGLVKAKAVAQNSAVADNTIVLFAGDGKCNRPSGGSNPTAAAQALAALTNTDVVIETIAIGTPCSGGLQQIPQNGGSCEPVDSVNDYDIESVIGTELLKVEWNIRGGAYMEKALGLPQDGPTSVSFDQDVTIELGNNQICVKANGDDVLPQPPQWVKDCITVKGVDDTPPAINCPDDITEPAIEDCSAVVYYTVTAPDNCDDDPELTLTEGLPSGATFPIGETIVEYEAEDMFGNTDDCSFTVTIIDDEDLDNDLLDCGGPGVISPCDVPVTYNTYYEKINGCPVDWEVTNFQCEFCNGAGKTVDKLAGGSCVVGASGQTFDVFDSGGVGDHITFHTYVTDDVDNELFAECAICVTKPPKGGCDRRNLRNLKPFRCPSDWDINEDYYTCPDQ